ncbi:terminase TerL endonuclease subunit [Turicibacter sanguinis]|uniref:terminase TerL endonuclease subunit n=1 Tax=Turicibacter sanguinis TaxID=154288 RepID=UPI001E6486AC|nr:terminase TerL endonuclease subunit [Turicibacter sanguinis]MDB8552165.1 terminase large subunit [Turicibacter sanguinis]
MIYNKYIDAYIYKVETGEVIVGEDIKNLIKNVINPKLSQPNIVIKHDKIEQEITKINEYFPFKLLDWQEFIIALTHCYYDDDQLVWDIVFIMCGRGAGKNGFMSGLCFYYTTPFHGVRAYNVDIVANSEKQAKTSFFDVYDVIDTNPKLQKAFKYTKEEILMKKTNSYIHFNTSNAKTKDGLRPGVILFDEIHEFEDYNNIKVFTSALGKKQYPRTFIITTNGNVRGGVLDNYLELADAILKGENQTSKMLPILFRLDHEDEVDDFEMWNKANPSLKYFPTLKSKMIQEYHEMQHQPQLAIEFMTKRMNLPAQESYSVVAEWEKIKATNREIPDLKGQKCIGAIDYASVRDFCSVGLLFKHGDERVWFQHTFICHLALKLEHREFKFDIELAKQKGLCTIIYEDSINEKCVANWFLEQAKKYKILNIVCDSYRKAILTAAFSEAGLPLNEVRNGSITHNKVYPLVEKLFADEKLIFGDDMMMRWYTNNVYVDTDPKGNKTYKKIEPVLRKTDGFFAFIHAISKDEEIPVPKKLTFFKCKTY